VRHRDDDVLGHSKIGWSMSAMGQNVILGVIKRDRVSTSLRGSKAATAASVSDARHLA
jgi:hypothetical protein